MREREREREREFEFTCEIGVKMPFMAFVSVIRLIIWVFRGFYKGLFLGVLGRKIG